MLLQDMFNGCSSLKEIDISNIKSRKQILMYCMFKNCSSLKKVELPNFDSIETFIDAHDMFYGCSSLEEINISDFMDYNGKRRKGDFKGMFYQFSEEFQNKVKAEIKNIEDDAFR